MRNTPNSYLQINTLRTVIAIAKAIVIAIARNPLVKCRGFKEIMSIACQIIEGRLERVDPSFPIPQRMVNQTNFHSRPLVVLKGTARGKPITVTVTTSRMGPI